MSRALVVHVIESLGIGGAERRLVSDLRWLSRGRYEHRVIFLTRANELEPELRAQGIDTAGLGLRSIRQAPQAITRLLRTLHAWRPAIVHTSVFGADVYGRLAAAACGVPRVVSTVQTLPYEPALARYYSKKRFAIDRWTARRFAHRFVAVSEPVRQGLIERFGLDPAHVTVIPNGVDLARFSPATPQARALARGALGAGPGAFVLMAVGRLIAEKDHATLIRALAQLRGSLPQACLAVIGEGPRRPALEALIREQRLTDRVRLLGARADVERWLPGADLFVFPSVREGLPVALLEAMASGLPVIASSIPQHAAIVRHGETGWSVPAEDPEAWAARIIEAAQLPEAARASVAQRGCAHVTARFSAERLAGELEALYDTLAPVR